MGPEAAARDALSRLGVTSIDNIVPLHGGVASANFLCHADGYPSGAVVRVDQRPVEEAMGDFANMRAAASAGVPVPGGPHLATTVRAYTVSIRAYVPGRHPDAGVLSVAKVGWTVGRLHATDVKHRRRSVYCSLETQLSHAVSLSDSDLSWANEKWRQIQAACERAHLRLGQFLTPGIRLTHGDLKPENVVMAPGMTVIDWEKSGSCSPELDIGSTLFNLVSLSPRSADSIVHEFREDYQGGMGQTDRISTVPSPNTLLSYAWLAAHVFVLRDFLVARVERTEHRRRYLEEVAAPRFEAFVRQLDDSGWMRGTC